MTRALALARLAASNQVARFLVLGGFAAAVNWVVRFPLSMVLPFEPAVFVAYLIGMSVGFTLYRRFVFPGSRRPMHIQVALFLAVNAAGAVVVMAVAGLLLAALSALAQSAPVWMLEGFAHGVAIGVGAAVNFIGHRTLTFAAGAGRSDGERHQAHRRDVEPDRV